METPPDVTRVLFKNMEDRYQGRDNRMLSLIEILNCLVEGVVRLQTEMLE